MAPTLVQNVRSAQRTVIQLRYDVTKAVVHHVGIIAIWGASWCNLYDDVTCTMMMTSLMS